MDNPIKIKVCGMRDRQNIEQLVKLKPHYIGFIFYNKSPRYAGSILTPETAMAIPETIKKTGVFVNADIKTIKATCQRFNLQVAQLHGKETPEHCMEIRRAGYEVIKAFSLKQPSDLDDVLTYNNACDFFLFDTPTDKHGGSGEKFDWSVLNNFNEEKPFFLSGGIEEADSQSIRHNCPYRPYAVDINSRFEVSPGLKNIEAVRRFMMAMKQKST
ncbi:phosphoribosylanthranilate isomerase [Anaerophaga thermohalophila]|jgi:phosphoribosylanthranilate isomerase|uniref:phosphoribosylanthranilate isomerase n=1 Tax=Anaerophaga thermohalophila TaxID=177400 RepID=UPI0002EEB1A5|nr:phosphoribosylanthranilate isomerase [Anaerophaga thermohalophila]